MILNDTVRQTLTAGHLAHLVTLNKDGSPQISIVWVGLDGDEIVCGHLTTHLYQKIEEYSARCPGHTLDGDGWENWHNIRS
jgi:hypothetical protein